jgi:hypothetical protein
MSLIQEFVKKNTLDGTAALEHFQEGLETDFSRLDPSPSLESFIIEINDICSEQRAVSKDIAALSNAMSGMEDYRSLLEYSLQKDGVSKETIVAMSVGLEQYGKLLGGDIEVFPSLENFDDVKKGTRELAQKIWEWIKKAWTVAKSIMRSLINRLKDLRVKLMLGTQRAAKRCGELAQRAKSMYGVKVQAGTTIDVKSPQKLLVGNVFEGQNTTLTKNITSQFMIEIPHILSTAINRAADEFKKYDGDLADVMFYHATSYFNLRSLTQKTVSASDKRFSGLVSSDKEIQVHRSETLPGNKAVYWTEVKGNSSKMTFEKTFEESAETNAYQFIASQRLELLPVLDEDTKGNDKGYSEIELRKAEELFKSATDLAAVCKQILSGSSSIDGLSQAYDRLGATSDILVNKLKDKDLDKKDESAIKVMLNHVNKLNTMGTSVGGMLSYLIGLVGGQLSIIELELSFLEKEKDKA